MTAIPLRRRLPGASSNLPGRPDPDIDPGDFSPRRPYSVLLPVGFAVPFPLPETRCALTAPFHPCRHPCGIGRFTFCGTFPEIHRACALLLPPDVIRHRMSMEPGLSSQARLSALARAAARPTDTLGMGGQEGRVKGGCAARDRSGLDQPAAFRLEPNCFFSRASIGEHSRGDRSWRALTFLLKRVIIF